MKYTVGLDVGIASVGWCVINEDKQRIEDLGVRTFVRAENPKDGSPLAEPRRLARGMRRRLQRRAQRLQNLRTLFVEQGLITRQEMKAFFEKAYEKDVYELRTEGLQRCLTSEEWMRVLYHLVKHRGFKSNRKSELKESDMGDLLTGISENKKILKDKGYQTVGEMLLKDEKFQEHKRNKGSSYLNTLSRDILEQEIQVLFEKQREFNNPFSAADFEEKYLILFNKQKHYADKDQILKMVGKCSFLPEEYRAPRMSYTAERFNLLTKISNLRLVQKGHKIELEKEQRETLIGLAYKHSSGVTYKQIRKALSIPEDVYFAGLRYGGRKSDAKEKDPESDKFYVLKGYHSLKNAVTESLGEITWQSLAGQPEKLDEIAWALTVYKSDEDIREYLSGKGIEDSIIQAVLTESFTRFLHVSIKALRMMMPYLEEGFRYDQACEKAGFIHYNPLGELERELYLPHISREDIVNPVVFRSVTQTRKVLNAIIRKYGSPYFINIELARDLGRNIEDRKKIEKKQLENRNERDRVVLELKETFNLESPRGGDILKYRLWKEQQGFCAYTKEYLKPERLFEPGYAEVDHILPWSRSFDDSYNNKVLVSGAQNQMKGNSIPFEYMGGNETSEKWHTYCEWVQSIFRNRRKVQNLLKTEFTEEDSRDVKERNLNDTRYITRFLFNLIKDKLVFAPGEDKQRVQTVNGQMTAILRGRWGLVKVRDENDRHHAMDAAVVACVTPGMVQRMSVFTKYEEGKFVEAPGGDFVGSDVKDIKKSNRKNVHFPDPWDKFRYELMARLESDEATLRNSLKSLELPSWTPEEIDQLHPIFVSRMPTRKVTGPAHAQTIRSAKNLDNRPEDRFRTVKTDLSKVKLAALENMLGKERDKRLYEAIKQRLEQFGDDPKKAFAEPLYKPTNDDRRGPIVRSIKIIDNGTSGVPVQKGVADNASMVRVDVFTKEKKYYLVPVYVADLVKKEIPNRAIIQGKDECDWTVIDDSFDFCFSLYPNDLIHVVTKTEEKFGYYISTHRCIGSISMMAPDRSWVKEGLGVKSAQTFVKYQVDPLGNYYPVRKEPRCGVEEFINQ